MEYVNENTFKDIIIKKPYHFIDLKLNDDNNDILDKCVICGNDINKKDNILDNNINNINIEDNSIIDLSKCPFCLCVYHMICLAQNSIKSEIALIPKMVECIVCSRKYNWSDFLYE
jgi:hypothetical protein